MREDMYIRGKDTEWDFWLILYCVVVVWTGKNAKNAYEWTWP